MAAKRKVPGSGEGPQVEMKVVSIDLVRPYWRNPRVISGAVDGVRTSIEQFGYVSPIMVDENMEIVAGHVRYRALRELHYEKIPVLVITGLTQAELRQYRIADNKVSEFSRWDVEKLAKELTGIAEEHVKSFFAEGEWNQLLGVEPPMPGPNDGPQRANDPAAKLKDLTHLEMECPYCMASIKVPLPPLDGEGGAAPDKPAEKPAKAARKKG